MPVGRDVTTASDRLDIEVCARYLRALDWAWVRTEPASCFAAAVAELC